MVSAQVAIYTFFFFYVNTMSVV
uniref:Uncharacterized protein n=1 Tax=Rhizophora mucronata TaxID=61149 RepID=A0A2P2P7I5_RHIMU